MHAPAHGGQPSMAPGSPRPTSRNNTTPLAATSLATAAYERCGSRIRVTVRGELDLDSARALRPDLFQALADSATGLDLDLAGLDFCDCAGLTVLLELRPRALSQGKTVALHTAGPAVDRLLFLLGVQDLLTGPDPRLVAALPHPAPDRVSKRDRHVRAAPSRHPVIHGPSVRPDCPSDCSSRHS
ncbi:STAS domain-containing protein [Streptomyces sp. NPDC014846]|jgi:anti-anti-sigma factor|uniref:STAS domain-containing protein n=1 Tax=unclassified Streptomyces TaxID=2593676 RepID=UPI0036F66423